MSNDHDFNDREDSDRITDPILSAVLQDIRSEPVPEFPASTLMSISAAPDVEDSASAKVRNEIWGFRWISVAGAAAVLFFIAFLVWPDSSQSAFARMQAALQDVRSVSYSVFDYHANGDT